MKVIIQLIIILFIFFISCNSPDKKSKKEIHPFKPYNFRKYDLKKADYYTKISDKVHGHDTTELKYINVEFRNFVNEQRQCFIINKFNHDNYYIIKTKHEAEEYFGNCGYINLIDFNKYVLIGSYHSSNGSDSIVKEALSITKSKTILIKIIEYDREDYSNIVYRYHTCLLLDRPKKDWDIKVLFDKK